MRHCFPYYIMVISVPILFPYGSERPYITLHPLASMGCLHIAEDQCSINEWIISSYTIKMGVSSTDCQLEGIHNVISALLDTSIAKIEKEKADWISFLFHVGSWWATHLRAPVTLCGSRLFKRLNLVQKLRICTVWMKTARIFHWQTCRYPIVVIYL